jgi:hypothetical protein
MRLFKRKPKRYMIQDGMIVGSGWGCGFGEPDEHFCSRSIGVTGDDAYSEGTAWCKKMSTVSRRVSKPVLRQRRNLSR